MTFLSTESNQEVGGMESDFHITEKMDEFGSVTRRGRLIKPTQKYQGMKWMTMRGRGKRGRMVEVPKSSAQVSFLVWSN